MAEPHIINALRNKRAELSGDRAQTEARSQTLQSEIAAVDITLRLFDPSQKPATIKPRIKRTKAARFRPGEFSPSLLGILRDAQGRMTVRELTHAVAQIHGLDVTSKDAFNKLMANTRETVSKPREDIARETVNGSYHFYVRL